MFGAGSIEAELRCIDMHGTLDAVVLVGDLCWVFRWVRGGREFSKHFLCSTGRFGDFCVERSLIFLIFWSFG